MTGETKPPDKLQQLLTRVDSGATPAEQVEATLLKLLKTTEVKNVSQHQGRRVADRVAFRDALKASEGTEFVLDSIRFHVTIPDYMFSKAALKK